MRKHTHLFLSIPLLGALSCTPTSNPIPTPTQQPTSQPSASASAPASPTPTVSLPTPTPTVDIHPSSPLRENILQRLEQIQLLSKNQVISPFAVIDRKQISWQSRSSEGVCVLPVTGSLACANLSGFPYAPLATVLKAGGLLASAGGGWSSIPNDAGISAELSRAGYFANISSPLLTEWEGFSFHDLALSDQGDGYLLLDDERPVSKETGEILGDLKETSLRYVSIRGYKPQHAPEVLVGLNYLGKGFRSVNGGNIDANGNGFAIYEPRNEPEVTRRVQYFSNLKPTNNVVLKIPDSRTFSIDMQGNSGHLLWAKGQSIHIVPIKNNQLSTTEQIIKLNTSLNFDLYVHPQRLDPTTFATYTPKIWDALLDQQGNGAIIVYTSKAQQNASKAFNALEVFKVEGYQVINKTAYDVPNFQGIYNAKLLNNQGIIELVLLMGKCELKHCQVREPLSSQTLWKGPLY